MHDKMENAFTKRSLGCGDVANFKVIQRETMWVLKIMWRSSQLFPFDLKYIFIRFALLEREAQCNCSLNLLAEEAKTHVNSTVLRTPTTSIALDPYRRQEAKPQSYCENLSLHGRASHLASIFCVINVVQNKVWHVCLFKRSRGKFGKEKGTLTEMRGVGDETLQTQQSKAVFIKKPSETPYYENLAEERCASDSLDLMLAFLEPKEHSSPCQTDRAGHWNLTSKKLPKSGVSNM